MGVLSDPLPNDFEWVGCFVYIDEWMMCMSVSPAQLWLVIEGIGGENGWYFLFLLWVICGWMDCLVGGVGLVCGCWSCLVVMVGDVLDFWCVEVIESGHLLRLCVEMKVFGGVWFELCVSVDGDGVWFD